MTRVNDAETELHLKISSRALGNTVEDAKNPELMQQTNYILYTHTHEIIIEIHHKMDNFEKS